MLLVELTETSRKEWDIFCSKENASVFSYSNYVLHLTHHCYILYSTNNKGGMLVPYASFLGKKAIQNPLFWRYSEWLGEKMNVSDEKHWEMVVEFLNEKFHFGSIQLKTSVLNLTKRVHQTIQADELHLSTLAKRNLKKAKDFSVIIENNPSILHSIIQKELTKKIVELKHLSIDFLNAINSENQYFKLIQLNLYDKQKIVGGIFLIQTKTEILYLKGTCEEAAKKSGGMYLLLHSGIEIAAKENVLFDFGGSSAKGVRDFNLKFGAKDVEYSLFSLKKLPYWFKIGKNIKKVLSRGILKI